MLANVVKGQKMAFTNMLAKKGYFQSKGQGLRAFSSVIGGQEGSTVSQINFLFLILIYIRLKKGLVITQSLIMNMMQSS